jgi:Iap family predicted aminopeptidase
MATDDLAKLEAELLNDISRDRLWEYVSTIAKDERMSGSPAEREAMDYIARTMRSWGVEVSEYEHDGYVSEPRRARLSVLEPEAVEIECITHSFAASATLEGEVVDAANGSEADYAGRDVRGKIVLVEGLAGPGKVVAAERHGATGAIFINDPNLHQMIVTPVWGTPTPETAPLIPSIPVVSVRLGDGDRFKGWLQQGPVRVEMETEVWTGWARLPVVAGDIKGVNDPDRFIMLAGHIDSWFYGAIDNAAANATTLEVMRVLAANQNRLRRSFRAVFWSGHSHGRYAGSTWYADTFWEEFYDHCVAYVNVDSTGATQATLYEELLAMPETAQLAIDVVRDLTGQTAEVNRIGRAGDQSFWGIGVPSVYMSLSRVPIETAPELSRAMGALTGRKKSGQAWFWHTEHDTLDKVDLDVLETDTRIYLATILQLLNSPVLPLDYVATVDEILDALEAYQAEANDAVDLQTAVERAKQLRELLIEFHRCVASVSGEDELDIVNQTLIDLGRMLVPLNYTESGQFDHDLALHAPVIPALHEIDRLATLNPESDEYRFLRARLARRRNQVAFTLRQAVEHVDAAFDLLDTVKGGS